MKVKLPEYIKDFGNLRNQFHSGLFTTLLVGKVSGVVVLLLIGQDINQDMSPELKEQIVNTNTAWFLSGLVTGASSWIYYRMPKRLDNAIEERIKPWIEKRISKLF